MQTQPATLEKLEVTDRPATMDMPGRLFLCVAKSQRLFGEVANEPPAVTSR